jgi:basic amino acid/polyamine antiporter, APA family
VVYYLIMRQTNNTGLVRGVRRWDAVALMINCIIGAGIFGTPSQAYALTGSYSLVAFLVCALIVAVIAFCYAEVASRFTETGGPYLYAREAFGAAAGFQVGWLAWLARLSSFAFICNVLVSYLSYFWPPAGSGFWRVAVMTAVVAALTAVNLIGVSRAAAASDVFSVGKLIPLVLFGVVGLFFINSENYNFATPPDAGPFSLVVSQLFVSFTGFELALIAAGETRDPRRNMPFAMMVALIVVVLVYVLIQLVCIGTLPNLAASQKPLADASNIFMGAAGASVIVVGAIVSTMGTLNAILLAGSRLPFAMAEQNHLPRLLSATHRRFHTPHLSILLTAGVGLALALSGTFVYALTLAAVTKLLTSAATCAALPVLRRRKSSRPALYKMPAGIFFSTLSLLVCAWLLVNVGWRELRDVSIAAAFGLLLYVANRLTRRHSQTDERLDTAGTT